MKIKTLFGALILMLAASANADPIMQFEGCVNVDGALGSVGSAGCAIDDGVVVTDNIDTSGGALDGLGTVIVNIASAGAHYVGLFVDWDIDAPINTFFNEYGDSSGAAAAGQSWEIDEPGFVFGDIFNNFIAGALDNTNGVPAAAPDDPSMAIGWDFNLADGAEAVVTFLLSLESCAGGSGICLSHTDPDSDYTYYFSSTLQIRDPNAVPEPGTMLLLGAGLLGLGLRRRVGKKH